MRGSCCPSTAAVAAVAAMAAAAAMAACGDPDPGPPSPEDAAAPVDRFAFRGACAHPLGAGGEVAFPDTAAGAQTALRPFYVVNAGERAINGREYMRWTVEGPDAADFTVGSGSLALYDQEACSFHHMLPQIFSVGDACRVDVVFHPTTPGPKQATLRVTQELGATIDQVVPIRATAVARPTGVYASVPDLYLTQDGTINGPSFLIVNGGTTSVDLGSPSVTGPFAIAMSPPGWSCPSPLTPGGACTVQLSPLVASASGCPTGALTTTTAAIEVPLSARFQPWVLTIDPPSAGSVRVDPVGALCTAQGTACRVSVDTPTALTLTAIPDAGGHFLGWYAGGQLAPCGTAAVCALAAGATSVHLEARFATAQARAIAIAIVGAGTVSAGYAGSCASSCTLYAEPGPVGLTATTAGVFVGWSGDCAGAQPVCNLGTVINDRAVTATFSP